MSKNTLLTWRKFNDSMLAHASAEILGEAGIPSEIEDNSRLFEPSFAFNKVEQDIALKLDPKDFQKADACMYAHYRQQVDEAPSDYYLYAFNDKELREIIAKPDEWGHFDYLLAEKILNDRGTAPSTEQVAQLYAHRKTALSQPATASNSMIIGGYIMAFLFGMLGIILGSTIAFQKKNLPDGSRVFTYDGESRSHGRIIIFIACVTTTIWLISLLYRSYLMAG